MCHILIGDRNLKTDYINKNYTFNSPIIISDNVIDFFVTTDKIIIWDVCRLDIVLQYLKSEFKYIVLGPDSDKINTILMNNELIFDISMLFI